MDAKTTGANIDFVNLVMMLGTSASIYLGEGNNPIQKKVTIDLAKARGAINMLVALKEKTAGNLNAAESKLISEMISDLETKYVESMDLDEAVIKRLRKRAVGTPPKVQSVQDWVNLVRKKSEEQDEGK